MSFSTLKISQVSNPPRTEPTSYQSYTRAKPPKVQRFSRALLLGIAPWLAFNTAMSNGGSFSYEQPQGLSSGFGQNFQYEIPQSITLEHCVEPREWSPSGNAEALPGSFPYSSQTKIDLPLSSPSLFLIARGSQSGGAVDIITSSEQAQGSVGFRVVASYSRQDLRDSAKVCRVVRGGGENGVGIFTPEDASGAGQLNFYTTIILPEVPAGSDHLSVKRLQTDVPNTSHRVGDINKKVLFDFIALSGSNQLINVQSLSATIGIFRTYNGPITGNFDASSSLTLSTSNGPINVNIGLKNDKNGPETKFFARTNNGLLQAAISLISTTDADGSFDVTATTSNEQLDVNFPVAPVGAKLQLVASTSNSPAHVSLPPTYEGSFTLRSSTFSPPSLNRHDSVDPSGRGRQRTIQNYQVGRGQLDGNVYWGDERGQGTVDVRTSQDSVILDL